MQKKLMAWKTKGMNQDLSVSAFNPEFSFENMNLRLSTNEGNTLMSWVNEKGTAAVTIYDESENAMTIQGTAIGVAVLNSYLVLFTHLDSDGIDRIYRMEYTDSTKTSMSGVLLFYGVLDMDTSHPLETLASYESELIQKVYWTDGKNQLRFINIVGDIKKDSSNNYLTTQFDFVPELQLQEEVSVQKILGATGMFAPGVIQYAFTYYNKNGQESNIFYTTPLYYISYKERGASPEDKVENAFKITVKGVDGNFDFLRIYSIQRTSLNGTPVCKRIQDIAIDGLTTVSGVGLVASYTDSGFSGNTVDPTELLYKGGETIVAGTIEQKDNTLFMGNIEIERTKNWSTLKSYVVPQNVTFASDYRSFYPTRITTYNYIYANQLTAYSDSDKTISVPCGGFKVGDYYRCGIQFQHKSGKWSEPIFLKDYQIPKTAVTIANISRQLPFDGGTLVYVPTIKATLHAVIVSAFYNAGYRKARAVVVFPEMQDRVCLCQGVVNPTVYTSNHRTDGDLHAQSSWFFRPYKNKSENYSPIQEDGSVLPVPYGTLEYANKGIDTNVPSSGDSAWSPVRIKQVEIQGHFSSGNKFTVDNGFLTFHSPDIEFDDRLSLLNFENIMGYHVGDVNFSKTFSDIDIQTETPTASNAGGGFVHKSFNKTGPYGIVAGLFYDDFILDDWSDKIAKSEDAKSPYKWFVFPWHKNGSLNNDCTRPANLGTQTALLKKKVISNLRYSITTFKASNAGYTLSPAPQLFSSDEVSVVKLGDEIYQGNVDTMLTPDNPDGVYCAFNNSDIHAKDVDTPFNFNTLNRFLKTYSKEADSASNEGLYGWNGTKWENKDGQYGDHYVDIVVKKDPVRMKYKSTPHLVLKSTVMDTSHYNLEYDLPIMEVRRDLSGSNLTTFENTVFGGQSEDAFKENTWVPCGEPVKLVSGSALTIKYSYGDTYFQRWDCLKTYPFTREDTNQIVEIGSFMLETHSNIDGRYDRNRGQMNNLNMTPQNFNLLNPVYSQVDNFFSYKIMDADYYKNQKYPNQITWSKTKESAADTDLWTNVTLASVLELDGDKGEITSLQRLNDQLLCFQDKGISQILYNENTQISTTEGVPIEIANSGKVQGKRYLSGTVGCSNKWSICKTPIGLYFMDSNEKSIYRLGDSLQNISQQAGFNTWCKQNIPSAEIAWNPLFPVDTNSKSAFISIYDSLNQDVLFVNKNTALAYSEKFSVFTSFYDYGGASFFCNLDDTGIWVHRDNEYGLEGLWQLWKHQAGAYGVFYGNKKPYWMTLVGNPEPQADKIFTNIEFRAYTDMSNPGDHSKLPFDYIETWNEYQHGFANLDTRSGHYRMIHHTSDGNAHLAKKFRIWRCDIPRDNAEYDFNADAAKGIYRTGRHPMDRMRNPWLYIKLYKAEAGYRDALLRSEIHDLIMTYYS